MLRVLLKKSQEGTRVVYVPGNHDDDLRALIGVAVRQHRDARAAHPHDDCRAAVARAARRRVRRGDQARCVVGAAGAFAYRALLGLNRLVHWLNELMGRPYWSLAQHVKTQRSAKRSATSRRFGRRRCKRRDAAGVDGIVCGHIHKAEVVEQRRAPLLQRRRLGRELHGARRAAERRARAREVASASLLASYGRDVLSASDPRCGSSARRIRSTTVGRAARSRSQARRRVPRRPQRRSDSGARGSPSTALSARRRRPAARPLREVAREEHREAHGMQRMARREAVAIERRDRAFDRGVSDVRPLAHGAILDELVDVRPSAAVAVMCRLARIRPRRRPMGSASSRAYQSQPSPSQPTVRKNWRTNDERLERLR